MSPGGPKFSSELVKKRYIEPYSHDVDNETKGQKRLEET